MRDDLLVTKFLKSGSEEAFTHLYEKHIADLDRTAMLLCNHNKDLARDCLQETWIVVVRKLPGFKWNSTLKTWMTAILINIVRRQSVKEQRHTYRELQPEDEISAASNVEWMDLSEAVSKLPLGYREVLILHDVEGYTHKEIAGMLEIAEGTSKSQLFNARRLVRKFLNEKTNFTHE